MWLNQPLATQAAITCYRAALRSASPAHVIIDNLFEGVKLDEVMSVLHQPQRWCTQQHTYSALYVDRAEWQEACDEQRFVQRDLWQREASVGQPSNAADAFLSFLRGEEFMRFLSAIFNSQLTDVNVTNPLINTNYFRMDTSDFVRLHADDSPGRQVCMLLYLNKRWTANAGGELFFRGDGKHSIRIAPLYNRCVLFDPSSKGSEHWVAPLTAGGNPQYRYNVTSWYWTE
ncbi:MAG TPA: 2OG-Fe(II) oxygenase [Marinagarivorans sp.]